MRYASELSPRARDALARAASYYDEHQRTGRKADERLFQRAAENLFLILAIEHTITEPQSSGDPGPPHPLGRGA